MMMQRQILISMKKFQKKVIKLGDLKQAGYGISLRELMRIILRLFVNLRVVERFLSGVVLQAQ